MSKCSNVTFKLDFVMRSRIFFKKILIVLLNSLGAVFVYFIWMTKRNDDEVTNLFMHIEMNLSDKQRQQQDESLCCTAMKETKHKENEFSNETFIETITTRAMKSAKSVQKFPLCGDSCAC